jgi:rubrerythrin
MSDLTLEELDRQGAVCEAFSRVSGETRAAFLRKATVGGAALLAALGRPPSADTATPNDVDILNYALILEYLQASFYTETERIGALRGTAAQAARVVAAVERAHVKALRKALGSAAVKRPAFDFRGTTEDQASFLKTAVAFEDLAAAAYKAQAPLIKSRAVLAVAISIHSVEARHAAWMRWLFGILPAARAFDDPLSKPAVTRIIASSHFIVASRATGAKERPVFTG